jgi:hypothetical protein
MSRTLLGLGLEPFPAEVAVGQRSIDLYFNAPLSAAVSRGELARKNGELIKTKPPSDQKKWLKSRAASEGLYGVSQVVGRVDADIIRRVEARDASGAWTETYVRTSEVSAAARYAFDARVLGGARPVSGVVTYDPGRVDSSSIFVTPYLRSGDAEILAKAAGVVTTDGGVDDVFASVLSGKTVLDLFGARWSDRSGLKLEAPIFGPPVSISGASLRRVSGRRHLFLREGDRVRLNTKSGSVEIID